MAADPPAFRAHPAQFASFTAHKSSGTADRIHNGFGAFTQAAKAYAHRKAGEHFGSTATFDAPTEHHEGVGGSKKARSNVREWLRDTHQQYRDVHSNRGSFSERLHSDATKANFRHAVGGSINDYLQSKIKSHKKNFVRNILFRWAHTQFQSTMRSLKDDQRIFENTAKLRRGDPDMYHLTHNELREVGVNAHKYGGRDKDHILQAAANELQRRQLVKASEHAQYDIRRRTVVDAARADYDGKTTADKKQRKTELTAERAATREKRHQEKLDRQEQLHQQKLKHRIELRQVSGHGPSAKAAVEQTVRRASKEKKEKPAKEPKDLKIKKRTKSGGAIVESSSGKTYSVSAEKLAASRGKKSKSRGGVTPTRTSRR